MKAHIKAVHEKKTPHRCAICSKLFTLQGSLRHNEAVYLGQRICMSTVQERIHIIKWLEARPYQKCPQEKVNCILDTEASKHLTFIKVPLECYKTSTLTNNRS